MGGKLCSIYWSILPLYLFILSFLSVQTCEDLFYLLEQGSCKPHINLHMGDLNIIIVFYPVEPGGHFPRRPCCEPLPEQAQQPVRHSAWAVSLVDPKLSHSLQHHELCSPWNSPSQNAGVGSLSLLQGIFSTLGLNPGLPHCRRVLYQQSHKGSPIWG